MDKQTRLEAVYTAFNARDVDGVLVHFGPEVDWPMAFKGGRVVGHQAVRDYWRQQWSEIDPHVEPVGFEDRGAGRVAVTIAQTVRDLEGDVVAKGEVLHVYAFDADGLVARMDVEEPAAA